MAQFQLKIDANEFSAGNPSTSSIFTADRGMTRAVEHRILTAKFGDGYEQRVVDGINSKMSQFDVTFNNRTASSINLLAKFLDNKAGKNFNFTVTDYDGDTVHKVVCEAYNISYTRESIHSLDATFRKVYEP